MRSAELLRAELQRLRRPWWELHDASCEADRCRAEMRRLIDATKAAEAALLTPAHALAAKASAQSKRRPSPT
jgi:hypothetical protein